MSDREISVEVRAEGVEDLPGEVEGDIGSGGLGGGGGGATSGLLEGILGALQGTLGSLRGLTKAVGIISALLAGLAPVTEFLSMIADVISAFIAPIAAVIMRPFAAFLTWMLRNILPAWLSFVEENAGLIQKIATVVALFMSLLTIFPLLTAIALVLKALPEGIWARVKNLAGRIWGYVKQLPRMIWGFVSQLPAKIGDEISSRIPGVGGAGDATRRAEQTAGEIVREVSNVNITLEGGLEALIEQIEEDGTLDWLP